MSEEPSISVMTAMISLEMTLQEIDDLMKSKALTPYVRSGGEWTIRNARKHSGLPIQFKRTQVQELKRARRNSHV